MTNRLVTAWDKTTGVKHPVRVPKHFLGHKVLGPNLVGEEPTKLSAPATAVANAEAGKAAAKNGGKK